MLTVILSSLELLFNSLRKWVNKWGEARCQSHCQCVQSESGGGEWWGSWSPLSTERPHPTIWAHTGVQQRLSQASCLLSHLVFCMHGWISGIKISACSFLALKRCCDLSCLLPPVCMLSTSSNFASYDSRSRCRRCAWGNLIFCV